MFIEHEPVCPKNMEKHAKSRLISFFIRDMMGNVHKAQPKEVEDLKNQAKCLEIR